MSLSRSQGERQWRSGPMVPPASRNRVGQPSISRPGPSTPQQPTRLRRTALAPRLVGGSSRPALARRRGEPRQPWTGAAGSPWARWDRGPHHCEPGKANPLRSRPELGRNGCRRHVEPTRIWLRRRQVSSAPGRAMNMGGPQCATHRFAFATLASDPMSPQVHNTHTHTHRVSLHRAVSLHPTHSTTQTDPTTATTPPHPADACEACARSACIEVSSR